MTSGNQPLKRLAEGIYLRTQTILLGPTIETARIATSSATYRDLNAVKEHGIRTWAELGSITVIISDQNEGLSLRAVVAARTTKVVVVSISSLGVGHVTDGIDWCPMDTRQAEDLLDDLRIANVAEFGIINENQALKILALSDLRRSRYSNQTYRVIDEWSTTLAFSTYGDELPILQVGLFPRPYQSAGFQWLCWIRDHGLGGLLGDQMGLGKTLQILMLVSRELRQGRLPNLVVCPASLVSNWSKESVKFIGVDPIKYTGDMRNADPIFLMKAPLVITTYETVRRDQLAMQLVNWNLVVADEAQNIKNPEAARAQSLKSLPSHSAIAVTGTPIENGMDDFWSIMDFCLKGAFGTLTEFRANYSNDPAGPARLSRTMKPLVLRRSPESVGEQLPERIEIPIRMDMQGVVAAAYDAAGTSAHSKLALLTALRQICSYDPSKFNNKRGFEIDNDSGKFAYLEGILSEIVARDERLLVFAPFSKTIESIQEFLLTQIGLGFVRIVDGSTPVNERQKIIDDFSCFGKAAALVLNPRAAGVGLNIQAANHVIHFSPEWNPAVVDQATARAHRKGQTRPVNVHYLFFADTIEEVMVDRLSSKRDLSAQATPHWTDSPTDVEFERILGRFKRKSRM